jgi:hypothetical protein
MPNPTSQPGVRYTINVGPDLFVDIMDLRRPDGTFNSAGDQRASTIRIRRGDAEIIYDPINDQPLSQSDVQYIGAGGNDSNVAVRSGRDKDVITCYAVRGNDVFCNKNPAGNVGRFRFGHHGDGLSNYGFGWGNSTTLNVKFGQQTGVVVWDATERRWNATGEQVTD